MVNKFALRIGALGLVALFLAALTVARAGTADSIVDLTNRERQAKGLRALKVNRQLTAAALAHARNMARQEQMNHELDGRNPSDRVNDTGYRWRAYGENIAYGYPGPKDVVGAWMDSTGHRENILNETFTEIGVAVAYSSKGVPYYCQVFGRPR